LDLEKHSRGKGRIAWYELPTEPEFGIRREVLIHFGVGDQLGPRERAIAGEECGSQVQHRFMTVNRSDVAVAVAIEYLTSLVDRPACPSLEAGVSRIAVGVREVVDEPSSWIDRVDIETAGCD
jgi:hypothetical protein